MQIKKKDKSLGKKFLHIFENYEQENFEMIKNSAQF